MTVTDLVDGQEPPSKKHLQRMIPTNCASPFECFYLSSGTICLEQKLYHSGCRKRLVPHSDSLTFKCSARPASASSVNAVKVLIAGLFKEKGANGDTGKE